MIRPLGDSFAPTSAADEEGKKPNPAQSAIQVLSMRLPRVKGARSISPLIGEPGSAARRETPGGFSPDSAVLQTLMRAQAPTGTADAMSAPMGSMPGASSAGASDPMAAAMAALGGGMMNAGPSAPPPPPTMPSYMPPAEMPQSPWTPLPPNVVPAENEPAPRANPHDQTPTQDGFVDKPKPWIGPSSGPSTGGLPPSAQPPIQQPPSRPEFPGANKPGPMGSQDMDQILGAIVDALRGRMR